MTGERQLPFQDHLGSLIGIDMAQWWSFAVPPGLEPIANVPPQSVGKGGVADRRLYAMMQEAGLADVRGFPTLVTIDDPEGPVWRYREDAILAGELEELFPIADLRYHLVVRVPLGAAELAGSGDDAMYKPPRRSWRFWEALPSILGGRRERLSGWHIGRAHV